MGYKIIEKIKLNDTVTKMVVLAPNVSKHAKAGQFIILKVDEVGERIPLTINDTNKELGTVTIIYQIVGLTTLKLDRLEIGDEIMDFVGPLGKPTDLSKVTKALVIGGGVGSAIAFPICKALYKSGVYVDGLLGFRNKDLIIQEEEFKKNSNHLYIYTDDGSNGNKGFVTTDLAKLIDENHYDEIFVIGPLIMMKMVSLITKEKNVKTTVSMNPLMIDGTGMCGCCRVMVDGVMKFACVDGPDFDGHKINFDEMILRNKMYQDIERKKYSDNCNLFKK